MKTTKWFLAAGILVGTSGLLTGDVVKSTTEDPPARQTSSKSKKASKTVRIAGAGAFGSSSALAVAGPAVGMRESAGGKKTVGYTENMPNGGTHTRLITTVITGVSFVQAKVVKVTGPRIAYSHAVHTYETTLVHDGVTEVVLTGSLRNDLFVSRENAGSIKPRTKKFIKTYANLVTFTGAASLSTAVKIEAITSAWPTTEAAANGEIFATVVGM